MAYAVYTTESFDKEMEKVSCSDKDILAAKRKPLRWRPKRV